MQDKNEKIKIEDFLKIIKLFFKNKSNLLIQELKQKF